MEIEGESLDQILHQLYQAIDKTGQPHGGGSRGGTLELLGVALRIRKPRARISRSENRGKPFSAIGELLWYLSGSDRLEFIEPYVGEYVKDAVDGMLEGAYGPRLLAMRGNIDQLRSIEKLLNRKSGSRRAVIQLFNAEDIVDERKEIPCTTTMQFHQRDRRLHMSVTLRSNDAYWGLPHDVFCFTMIQEMMARRLDVELGEYYQYVGSMHVYEKFFEGMREYVDEGVQQTIEMPPMPPGNPFDIVDKLLEIEKRLRAGELLDASKEVGDPYWADVVRLLQVFWARQWAEDYSGRLTHLRQELASASYRPYIDARLHLKGRASRGAAAPLGAQHRGNDVAN
ncbi:MAG TPA: thymidylate synthase [Allosphingosinicella sp.]|jgi:thymidylate synthase